MDLVKIVASVVVAFGLSMLALAYTIDADPDVPRIATIKEASP